MVYKVKAGPGRPKEIDYPLERISILLRAGDYGWLQIMKGPGGAAKFVRQMLIDYVDREQSPGPIDLDTTIGTLENE